MSDRPVGATPRGRAHHRVWIAALALAGSVAPIAAAGGELLPRLEPWPLATRDLEAVAGWKTSRAAGPLFTAFEKDDGTHGWALAPFLARLHTPGQISRLEFLYPLGLYSSQPDGWKFRLTPFVDLDRSRAAARATPESEQKGRGWSFLLAFGGRSESGERYFGVFPFGGVAKDRFGRRRIEFLLFPLFGRSWDHRGFRRTHLLWPFFSWGSNGERRLLRIWPFYGHDLWKRHYTRRYALWPFLHWRHERIGAITERQIRLFLPFYGESVRAHARARFVLGPLYVHSENDLTGAHSRTYFWPFVRLASRPPSEAYSGSSEIRFEPFFRRRIEPGSIRTDSLFGAIEHSQARGEEVTRTRWRVLWVSRLMRERVRKSGVERLRFDVWPMWRFSRRRSPEAGERGRLFFPWLVPIRGEGWERSWLAPFTLYERRWVRDQSRSDALWGLWRERRRDGRATDSLGWLLRRDRFSDGTRQLRLFTLPVWHSD